ncbi:MAG: hypothetical protein M1831_004301 [Alyxoria varia]|nr:MAG: hypothetical protein M1831_004301 [Alyxoria varia]
MPGGSAGGGIKGKDLQYESIDPPFLQRLKNVQSAQDDGSGPNTDVAAGRRVFDGSTRRKGGRTGGTGEGEDDDDAPVVVDDEGLLEEQQQRQRQEGEAGSDGEDGGQGEGDGESARKKVEGKMDGRRVQGVEVGGGASKRKRKVAGRVVGAEEDVEEELQRKNGEDSKSRKVNGGVNAKEKVREKKKAKAKAKAKKGGGLSFGDGEHGGG